MLRQADRPCSKCGSMYRTDSNCNKCGSYEPVPESFYSEDRFSKAGKETEGRRWSKKLHRYLKPGE